MKRSDQSPAESDRCAKEAIAAEKEVIGARGIAFNSGDERGKARPLADAGRGKTIQRERIAGDPRTKA
jgi:hypothetical protein